MTKLILCLVVLATLTCVSATIQSLELSTTVTDGQVEPISTTLSKWLVDRVAEKIVAIAKFFHLKLRVARFLVSLYTTENLVLLRNLIEYQIKLGNLALRLIPLSTEDPGYWWIPTITQFLNINVGSGGLFGLFLGPPTEINPDESSEAPSESTDDIVTNPPIIFNAPLSSTEQPESNDVNTVSSDSIRDSRSIIVNEKNPEIVENEKQPHEDVLKVYQGRIMSLDKLINSRRK